MKPSFLCPKCFTTYNESACPTCGLETYYYPADYRRLREYGFNQQGKCFVDGKRATLEYIDQNGVVFPVCSDACRSYVRERSEEIPLTKDNELFWDLDEKGRCIEEQATKLECDPDHPFTYRIMFEWESGDPESCIAYHISCDVCNRAWSAYLYREDELFYDEVQGDGE